MVTAVWGISKKDTLEDGAQKIPTEQMTSHVQNFGEDAMFVESNGSTQVIGWCEQINDGTV